MQPQMQHHATHVAGAARARVAYGNGLMALGSWSIRSCFTVPTTDHKAMSPGRSEVIPW